MTPYVYSAWALWDIALRQNEKKPNKQKQKKNEGKEASRLLRDIHQVTRKHRLPKTVGTGKNEFKSRGIGAEQERRIERARDRSKRKTSGWTYAEIRNKPHCSVPGGRIAQKSPSSTAGLLLSLSLPPSLSQTLFLLIFRESSPLSTPFFSYSRVALLSVQKPRYPTGSATNTLLQVLVTFVNVYTSPHFFFLMITQITLTIVVAPIAYSTAIGSSFSASLSLSITLCLLLYHSSTFTILCPFSIPVYILLHVLYSTNFFSHVFSFFSISHSPNLFTPNWAFCAALPEILS